MIRSFMQKRPDSDATLTLCANGDLRDARGEQVLLKFHGDHFFLNQRPKGELPEDSFYTVEDQPLSITPSDLERLNGKKLVVEFYSFGPRSILTLFTPRYRIQVLRTVALSS